MRRMLDFCCVAFLLAMPLSPAVAESPPPNAEQMLLVQRLGDPRFAERQKATRQLRALGLAAISELKIGAESNDPEIRYRAQVLLAALYELEQQETLDAFLADPESERGSKLIGWSRYRSFVGAERADRELLADMHREEGRLLRGWAIDTAETTEAALNRRCIEVQNAYRTSGRREVKMASIAALLFVAADPKIPVTDRTCNVLNSLLHYNNIKSELTRKDQDKQPVDSPLKRLAARWVEREGSVNTDYQKLLLSMRYQILTGLRPAKRLLQDAVAPLQTQYALLAIGKLGSPEDLAIVEPFLLDKTVLSQSMSGGRVTYRCEIRDVALAISVHLLDKSTQSLGFARLRNNSSYLFSPNSAGFASEEKRSAAFAQWERWRGEELGD